MKLFKLLLLLAFLGLGIFVAKFVFFKPFSISHFFERIYYSELLRSPENLSYTRLLDPYGFSWFHKEWDNSSEEAEDQRIERAKKNLELLNDYSLESLTESERVSKDVIRWSLELSIEGDQFRYHSFPVNQLFGLQSEPIDFLLNIHPLDSKFGAEAFIERLKKTEQKFLEGIQQIKVREGKGLLPPKFVLTKVREEMEGFLASKVDSNVLLTQFTTKIQSIKGLTDPEVQKLKEDCKNALVNNFLKGYSALLDVVKHQEVLAKTDDGVWRLPDGDKYYQFCLKRHTTLSYKPEEIHNLGLSEVARIQAEMKSILASIGKDTTKSVGFLMNQLAEDPKYLFPENEEGRTLALAEYTRIIENINSKLGDEFPTKPKAPVKVERIPAFKELTSPGAYYQGPSMDGTRPGVFYANLSKMAEVPKFGMATLSYHEAVPGHHFQVALQQEMKDLPTFRKLNGYTVYAEGWALYAERLAKELGFIYSPEDDLGRLQAELFRAVRLVVDSGIHHKRWTREQAVAYMSEKTGMGDRDVRAEIDRYIVWPGQACAYKTGMIKILELRTKAQKELGTKFKLGEFHDIVLTNGSTPMPVLEALVDSYINNRKAY